MKGEVIPRLFPIVVHYGNKAATEKLVEQLRSSSLQPTDIIIIDNDKNNAGYAGGVNRALGMLMRGAKPEDIVIALNNDVSVSRNSLEAVQNWWQKNPAPALAGVKMGYVNLTTGRSDISASTADPPTWRASFVLPYLHGSCLIAPLKIFLALQGLPSQYFIYWEDVDFSRRARQVGLPLKIIPDTGIVHNDSLHTLTDDQLYYLVRNGAFFLSHYSPRPWRYYWRVCNPLRFLYHWLSSHHTVTQALHNALRNKLGPRT